MDSTQPRIIHSTETDVTAPDDTQHSVESEAPHTLQHQAMVSPQPQIILRTETDATVSDDIQHSEEFKILHMIQHQTTENTQHQTISRSQTDARALSHNLHYQVYERCNLTDNRGLKPCQSGNDLSKITESSRGTICGDKEFLKNIGRRWGSPKLSPKEHQNGECFINEECLCSRTDEENKLQATGEGSSNLWVDGNTLAEITSDCFPIKNIHLGQKVTQGTGPFCFINEKNISLNNLICVENQRTPESSQGDNCEPQLLTAEFLALSSADGSSRSIGAVAARSAILDLYSLSSDPPNSLDQDNSQSALVQAGIAGEKWEQVGENETKLKQTGAILLSDCSQYESVLWNLNRNVSSRCGAPQEEFCGWKVHEGSGPTATSGDICCDYINGNVCTAVTSVHGKTSTAPAYACGNPDSIFSSDVIEHPKYCNCDVLCQCILNTDHNSEELPKKTLYKKVFSREPVRVYQILCWGCCEKVTSVIQPNVAARSKDRVTNLTGLVSNSNDSRGLSLTPVASQLSTLEWIDNSSQNNTSDGEEVLAVRFAQKICERAGGTIHFIGGSSHREGLGLNAKGGTVHNSRTLRNISTSHNSETSTNVRTSLSCRTSQSSGTSHNRRTLRNISTSHNSETSTNVRTSLSCRTSQSSGTSHNRGTGNKSGARYSSRTSQSSGTSHNSRTGNKSGASHHTKEDGNNYLESGTTPSYRNTLSASVWHTQAPPAGSSVEGSDGNDAVSGFTTLTCDLTPCSGERFNILCRDRMRQSFSNFRLRCTFSTLHDCLNSITSKDDLAFCSGQLDQTVRCKSEESLPLLTDKGVVARDDVDSQKDSKNGTRRKLEDSQVSHCLGLSLVDEGQSSRSFESISVTSCSLPNRGGFNPVCKTSNIFNNNTDKSDTVNKYETVVPDDISDNNNLFIDHVHSFTEGSLQTSEFLQKEASRTNTIQQLRLNENSGRLHNLSTDVHIEDKVERLRDNKNGIARKKFVCNFPEKSVFKSGVSQNGLCSSKCGLIGNALNNSSTYQVSSNRQSSIRFQGRCKTSSSSERILKAQLGSSEDDKGRGEIKKRCNSEPGGGERLGVSVKQRRRVLVRETRASILRKIGQQTRGIDNPAAIEDILRLHSNTTSVAKRHREAVFASRSLISAENSQKRVRINSSQNGEQLDTLKVTRLPKNMANSVSIKRPQTTMADVVAINRPQTTRTKCQPVKRTGNVKVGKDEAVSDTIMYPSQHVGATSSAGPSHLTIKGSYKTNAAMSMTACQQKQHQLSQTKDPQALEANVAVHAESTHGIGDDKARVIPSTKRLESRNRRLGDCRVSSIPSAVKASTHKQSVQGAVALPSGVHKAPKKGNSCSNSSACSSREASKVINPEASTSSALSVQSHGEVASPALSYNAATVLVQPNNEIESDAGDKLYAGHKTDAEEKSDAGDKTDVPSTIRHRTSSAASTKVRQTKSVSSSRYRSGVAQRLHKTETNILPSASPTIDSALTSDNTKLMKSESEITSLGRKKSTRLSAKETKTSLLTTSSSSSSTTASTSTSSNSASSSRKPTTTSAGVSVCTVKPAQHKTPSFLPVVKRKIGGPKTFVSTNSKFSNSREKDTCKESLRKEVSIRKDGGKYKHEDAINSDVGSINPLSRLEHGGIVQTMRAENGELIKELDEHDVHTHEGRYKVSKCVVDTADHSMNGEKTACTLDKLEDNNIAISGTQERRAEKEKYSSQERIDYLKSDSVNDDDQVFGEVRAARVSGSCRINVYTAGGACKGKSAIDQEEIICGNGTNNTRIFKDICKVRKGQGDDGIFHRNGSNNALRSKKIVKESENIRVRELSPTSPMKQYKTLPSTVTVNGERRKETGHSNTETTLGLRGRTSKLKKRPFEGNMIDRRNVKDSECSLDPINMPNCMQPGNDQGNMIDRRNVKDSECSLDPINLPNFLQPVNDQGNKLGTKLAMSDKTEDTTNVLYSLMSHTNADTTHVLCSSKDITHNTNVFDTSNGKAADTTNALDSSKKITDMADVLHSNIYENNVDTKHVFEISICDQTVDTTDVLVYSMSDKTADTKRVLDSSFNINTNTKTVLDFPISNKRTDDTSVLDSCYEKTKDILNVLDHSISKMTLYIPNVLDFSASGKHAGVTDVLDYSEKTSDTTINVLNYSASNKTSDTITNVLNYSASNKTADTTNVLDYSTSDKLTDKSRGFRKAKGTSALQQHIPSSSVRRKTTLPLLSKVKHLSSDREICEHDTSTVLLQLSSKSPSPYLSPDQTSSKEKTRIDTVSKKAVLVAKTNSKIKHKASHELLTSTAKKAAVCLVSTHALSARTSHIVGAEMHNRNRIPVSTKTVENDAKLQLQRKNERSQREITQIKTAKLAKGSRTHKGNICEGADTQKQEKRRADSLGTSAPDGKRCQVVGDFNDVINTENEICKIEQIIGKTKRVVISSESLYGANHVTIECKVQASVGEEKLGRNGRNEAEMNDEKMGTTKRDNLLVENEKVRGVKSPSICLHEHNVCGADKERKQGSKFRQLYTNRLGNVTSSSTCVLCGPEVEAMMPTSPVADKTGMTRKAATLSKCKQGVSRPVTPTERISARGLNATDADPCERVRLNSTQREGVWSDKNEEEAGEIATAMSNTSTVQCRVPPPNASSVTVDFGSCKCREVMCSDSKFANTEIDNDAEVNNEYFHVNSCIRSDKDCWGFSRSNFAANIRDLHSEVTKNECESEILFESSIAGVCSDLCCSSCRGQGDLEQRLTSGMLGNMSSDSLGIGSPSGAVSESVQKSLVGQVNGKNLVHVSGSEFDDRSEDIGDTKLVCDNNVITLGQSQRGTYYQQDIIRGELEFSLDKRSQLCNIGDKVLPNEPIAGTSGAINLAEIDNDIGLTFLQKSESEDRCLANNFFVSHTRCNSHQDLNGGANSSCGFDPGVFIGSSNVNTIPTESVLESIGSSNLTTISKTYVSESIGSFNMKTLSTKYVPESGSCNDSNTSCHNTSSCALSKVKQWAQDVRTEDVTEHTKSDDVVEGSIDSTVTNTGLRETFYRTTVGSHLRHSSETEERYIIAAFYDSKIGALVDGCYDNGTDNNDAESTSSSETSFQSACCDIVRTTESSPARDLDIFEQCKPCTAGEGSVRYLALASENVRTDPCMDAYFTPNEHIDVESDVFCGKIFPGNAINSKTMMSLTSRPNETHQHELWDGVTPSFKTALSNLKANPGVSSEVISQAVATTTSLCPSSNVPVGHLGLKHENTSPREGLSLSLNVHTFNCIPLNEKQNQIQEHQDISVQEATTRDQMGATIETHLTPPAEMYTITNHKQPLLSSHDQADNCEKLMVHTEGDPNSASLNPTRSYSEGDPSSASLNSTSSYIGGDPNSASLNSTSPYNEGDLSSASLNSTRSYSGGASINPSHSLLISWSPPFSPSSHTTTTEKEYHQRRSSEDKTPSFLLIRSSSMEPKRSAEIRNKSLKRSRSSSTIAGIHAINISAPNQLIHQPEQQEEIDGTPITQDEKTGKTCVCKSYGTLIETIGLIPAPNTCPKNKARAKSAGEEQTNVVIQTQTFKLTTVMHAERGSRQTCLQSQRQPQIKLTETIDQKVVTKCSQPQPSIGAPSSKFQSKEATNQREANNSSKRQRSTLDRSFKGQENEVTNKKQFNINSQHEPPTLVEPSKSRLIETDNQTEVNNSSQHQPQALVGSSQSQLKETTTQADINKSTRSTKQNIGGGHAQVNKRPNVKVTEQNNESSANLVTTNCQTNIEHLPKNEQSDETATIKTDATATQFTKTFPKVDVSMKEDTMMKERKQFDENECTNTPGSINNVTTATSKHDINNYDTSFSETLFEQLKSIGEISSDQIDNTETDLGHSFVKVSKQNERVEHPKCASLVTASINMTSLTEIYSDEVCVNKLDTYIVPSPCLVTGKEFLKAEEELNNEFSNTLQEDISVNCSGLSEYKSRGFSLHLLPEFQVVKDPAVSGLSPFDTGSEDQATVELLPFGPEAQVMRTSLFESGYYSGIKSPDVVPHSQDVLDSQSHSFHNISGDFVSNINMAEVSAISNACSISDVIYDVQNNPNVNLLHNNGEANNEEYVNVESFLLSKSSDGRLENMIPETGSRGRKTDFSDQEFETVKHEITGQDEVGSVPRGGYSERIRHDLSTPYHDNFGIRDKWQSEVNKANTSRDPDTKHSTSLRFDLQCNGCDFVNNETNSAGSEVNICDKRTLLDNEACSNNHNNLDAKDTESSVCRFKNQDTSSECVRKDRREKLTLVPKRDTGRRCSHFSDVKKCSHFSDVKQCSHFSDVKQCSHFSDAKQCSHFSDAKQCSHFSDSFSKVQNELGHFGEDSYKKDAICDTMSANWEPVKLSCDSTYRLDHIHQENSCPYPSACDCSTCMFQRANLVFDQGKDRSDFDIPRLGLDVETSVLQFTAGFNAADKEEFLQRSLRDSTFLEPEVNLGAVLKTVDCKMDKVSDRFYENEKCKAAHEIRSASSNAISSHSHDVFGVTCKDEDKVTVCSGARIYDWNDYTYSYNNCVGLRDNSKKDYSDIGLKDCSDKNSENSGLRECSHDDYKDEGLKDFAKKDDCDDNTPKYADSGEYRLAECKDTIEDVPDGSEGTPLRAKHEILGQHFQPGTGDNANKNDIKTSLYQNSLDLLHSRFQQVRSIFSLSPAPPSLALPGGKGIKSRNPETINSAIKSALAKSGAEDNGTFSRTVISRSRSENSGKSGSCWYQQDSVLPIGLERTNKCEIINIPESSVISEDVCMVHEENMTGYHVDGVTRNADNSLHDGDINTRSQNEGKYRKCTGPHNETKLVEVSNKSSTQSVNGSPNAKAVSSEYGDISTIILNSEGVTTDKVGQVDGLDTCLLIMSPNALTPPLDHKHSGVNSPRRSSHRSTETNTFILERVNELLSKAASNQPRGYLRPQSPIPGDDVVRIYLPAATELTTEAKPRANGARVIQKWKSAVKKCQVFAIRDSMKMKFSGTEKSSPALPPPVSPTPPMKYKWDRTDSGIWEKVYDEDKDNEIKLSIEPLPPEDDTAREQVYSHLHVQQTFRNISTLHHRESPKTFTEADGRHASGNVAQRSESFKEEERVSKNSSEEENSADINKETKHGLDILQDGQRSSKTSKSENPDSETPKEEIHVIVERQFLDGTMFDNSDLRSEILFVTGTDNRDQITCVLPFVLGDVLETSRKMKNGVSEDLLLPNKGFTSSEANGSKSGPEMKNSINSHNIDNVDVPDEKHATLNEQVNTNNKEVATYIEKFAMYAKKTTMHTQDPSTYVGEPITYIDEPDTHTQEPITYIDEPDTRTQEPITYIDEPDTRTQEPITYIDEPDTRTQEPITYIEEPDTRTQEPITYIDEPDTRTQEPVTYIDEPDTRTQEPITYIDEPDTRTQEPITYIDEPDTRTQEPITYIDEPDTPDTRTQEPVTYIDEPDTRTQEPITYIDEPDTRTQEPITYIDEPDTRTQEPITYIDGPDTRTQEPVTYIDEPDTRTQEPITYIDEPDTRTQEPITYIDEPDTHTQEPITYIDEPDTHTQEPVSYIEKPFNITTEFAVKTCAKTSNPCLTKCNQSISDDRNTVPGSKKSLEEIEASTRMKLLQTSYHNIFDNRLPEPHSECGRSINQEVGPKDRGLSLTSKSSFVWKSDLASKRIFTRKSKSFSSADTSNLITRAPIPDPDETASKHPAHPRKDTQILGNPDNGLKEAENQGCKIRKYTWPSVAESLRKFQKSIAAVTPRGYLQRCHGQKYVVPSRQDVEFARETSYVSDSKENLSVSQSATNNSYVSDLGRARDANDTDFLRLQQSLINLSSQIMQSSNDSGSHKPEEVPLRLPNQTHSSIFEQRSLASSSSKVEYTRAGVATIACPSKSARQIDIYSESTIPDEALSKVNIQKISPDFVSPHSDSTSSKVRSNQPHTGVTETSTKLVKQSNIDTESKTIGDVISRSCCKVKPSLAFIEQNSASSNDRATEVVADTKLSEPSTKSVIQLNIGPEFKTPDESLSSAFNQKHPSHFMEQNSAPPKGRPTEVVVDVTMSASSTLTARPQSFESSRHVSETLLSPSQDASCTFQRSNQACWSAPSVAERSLLPSPVITLPNYGIVTGNSSQQTPPLSDVNLVQVSKTSLSSTHEKVISSLRIKESSPLSDTDSATPVLDNSSQSFPTFKTSELISKQPQGHKQSHSNGQPVHIPQQHEKTLKHHEVSEDSDKKATTTAANYQNNTEAATSPTTTSTTTYTTASVSDQMCMSSQQPEVRRHSPSAKLISVTVWDTHDGEKMLRQSRRLWTSEDKHNLAGISETEAHVSNVHSVSSNNSFDQDDSSSLLEASHDCTERVRASRSPVRPHQTKQRSAPRRSLSLPSGGLSYGDVKILYKDGHFVMVGNSAEKAGRTSGEKTGVLEEVREETEGLDPSVKAHSQDTLSLSKVGCEKENMPSEMFDTLERGIADPHWKMKEASLTFDGCDAGLNTRRTKPSGSIFYSLPGRKGRAQRPTSVEDDKLWKSQQSLVSQAEMERRRREEEDDDVLRRYKEGSGLRRNNSFTEAMGSTVMLQDIIDRRDLSKAPIKSRTIGENVVYTSSEKHTTEGSCGRKSRSKGVGFIQRMLKKRRGTSAGKSLSSSTSSLKPQNDHLFFSSLSLTSSTSSTSLQQARSDSRDSSLGRKISFNGLFKRRNSADTSVKNISISDECSCPPIVAFLSNDDIGAAFPSARTRKCLNRVQGKCVHEGLVGAGEAHSFSEYQIRSRSAKTSLSGIHPQGSLYRSFSHDDSGGSPVDGVSRRTRSLSERAATCGRIVSGEVLSADSSSEYDLSSPDLHNSDGTLTPRSLSPCIADLPMDVDQTLLASPTPSNRIFLLEHQNLTTSPPRSRTRSAGDETLQKSSSSLEDSYSTTSRLSFAREELISSSSNDSGIHNESATNSSAESIQAAVRLRKSRSPSPQSLEWPKSDTTVRWADLLEEVMEPCDARDSTFTSRHMKLPRPKSDTDQGLNDERPEKENDGIVEDKCKENRNEDEENLEGGLYSSENHRSILLNASSLGNISTSVTTTAIALKPSPVSVAANSSSDLRVAMQSGDSLLSLVELRRPCRDALSAKLAKFRRLSTPQPLSLRAEKPKPRPAKIIQMPGLLTHSHSMPDNLDRLTRKKNYFSLIDAQSVASQQSMCDDSSDESEYSMDYQTNRSSSSRSSHVMLAAIDQKLGEENLTYAEALWDHVTMDPDELVFRAGDVIHVTDASDKHWWFGNVDDNEGWFPATFVRSRVNQCMMEEELALLLTDEESLVARHAGKGVVTTSYMGIHQARANVVNEIISAEREYVKHLRDVVEGYVKQACKRPEMFPIEKVTVIFSNIEEIYDFATRLLADLERSVNSDQRHLSELGHCFLAKVKEFEMYSDYCNNHSAACEELRELYRNKRYRHFFEACRLLQEMIEIPLEGFLLTPVQKICKYHLQLAELLKFTPPGHPDFGQVQSALEAMKKIAMLINERKRKMESVEKLAAWQLLVDAWEGPDILDDSSELIYSGELNKINHAGWSQERYFFLFDHQLIYCKKDLLKKSNFCFKGRINMDSCDVVNVTDGREPQYGVTVRNAWKLHDTHGDKWYLLVAKTAAAKQRWLKAFQDERRRVKDDTENNFNIPYHIKQAVISNFKQKSNIHKPKGRGTLSRANTAQMISSVNRVSAIATLPRKKNRHKTKAEESAGKAKKINWFFFGKGKT